MTAAVTTDELSPKITPEEIRLHIGDYLSEKDRSDISAVDFGYRLAGLYKIVLGKEPSVMFKKIENQTLPVKDYRESHRYLFDEVLASFTH